MSLRKMLVVCGMSLVLAFGFSQLAMATSSCPATACEDLYWCDVDLYPATPCGGGYYILNVSACHVTTCYAPSDWIN